MKAALLACVLLGLTAQALGEETGMVDETEGRFLYFNTSSTATSLTLLGGLILLGVIFYLVYAGGILGESQKRQDYYQYDQYNYPNENAYSQFRSATEGYGFSGFDVLKWLSMAQELYEQFDVNDIECQKKLICQVMKEPEYYGSMARKVKTGFEFGAPYLELFGISDDMRELLDEWLDANQRSDNNKDCAEFFQCPFSIKDSVKRNFVLGNNL